RRRQEDRLPRRAARDLLHRQVQPVSLMVLLLGLWTALLAAAMPIGAVCLRLVAPGAQLAAADRLCLFAWCGLFALGSLLLALSLFVPLGSPYGVGAMVLASAAALASRGVRAELLHAALPGRQAIALIVVAAACAFAATVSTPPGDTG